MYRMFSPTSNKFLQYSFVKDTVIAGKIAKKLEVKKIEFQGPQNEIRYTEIAGSEYFYNSNDSIYFFDVDSFRFVYSFDPETGDQWITGSTRYFCSGSAPAPEDTFTVSAINSVVFGNRSYDLIENSSTDFLLGNIIRNIGPIVSPYPVIKTSLCFPPGTPVDMGSFESLVCYSDNVRGVVPVMNNTSFSCHGIITSIRQSNEIDQLSIFPNPSYDVINIIGGSGYTTGYSICDAWGRVLLKGRLANDQLDISALPDGFYFLTLQDRKNNLVLKFLKL